MPAPRLSSENLLAPTLLDIPLGRDACRTAGLSTSAYTFRNGTVWGTVIVIWAAEMHEPGDRRAERCSHQERSEHEHAAQDEFAHAAACISTNQTVNHANSFLF
jgi:hypothetical protein